MELSRDRIEEALRCSPASLGWPTQSTLLRPQFDIEVQDCVESTNTALWQRLRQGATSGAVVVASQQQAGRGQRGNSWRSLPGGLYLSLALEPDLPVADQAQLTLCTAWGIGKSLCNLGVPVQLKWLNDLVIGTHKLGGILTETHISQRVITQAVIGVGINWQNPVPDSGIALYDVVAAQPNSSITSLNQLAAIALHGMVHGYYQWRLHGSTWLCTAYESLWRNLHQSITVQGRSGTIIGITTSGDLNVHMETDTLNSESVITRIRPGTFNLGYR